MGEWGHAETVYPEGYEGPKLDDIDYIKKNPEHDKQKSHEKIDKRDIGGERAKTIYPPEYTPPKVDDNEDAKDLKKPVSPMVMKHQPVYSHESEYQKDLNEHSFWQIEPKFEDRRMRPQDLDWINKDTRSLYDTSHGPVYSPNYEQHYRYHYNNETIGAAMIEENEKERALELYKQKTESELQNEYDRKVMDLTKDYQRKLHDMDHKYSEKQFELDRERSHIETAIE